MYVKTCTVCKEDKGINDFYNCKASKDNKGYRCKVCDNKARAKWRHNNPERSREVARRKQIKHKYGISLEEYDEMLESQEGLCAICKCNVNSKRVLHNFAVDHDHITGKIRGLLCNQCNRAIGMLNDDPELLKIAYNYLL